MIKSNRINMTKEDYECFLCHRKQSKNISENIALAVGWAKVVSEDKWLCPFCSGQEDKLKAVFGQ